MARSEKETTDMVEKAAKEIITAPGLADRGILIDENEAPTPSLRRRSAITRSMFGRWRRFLAQNEAREQGYRKVGDVLYRRRRNLSDLIVIVHIFFHDVHPISQQ